jgi:hypothetical protein
MRKYFSTINRIKSLLKIFVESHPGGQPHRYSRQYEWILLCSYQHMSYLAILFPEKSSNNATSMMSVEYYVRTDSFTVYHSINRIPMSMDEFIEWTKLTYYDDDIDKFNIALDVMLIGIV